MEQMEPNEDGPEMDNGDREAALPELSSEDEGEGLSSGKQMEDMEPDDGEQDEGEPDEGEPDDGEAEVENGDKDASVPDPSSEDDDDGPSSEKQMEPDEGEPEGEPEVETGDKEAAVPGLSSDGEDDDEEPSSGKVMEPDEVEPEDREPDEREPEDREPDEREPDERDPDERDPDEREPDGEPEAETGDKEAAVPDLSSEDDDEGPSSGKKRFSDEFVYDFDLMMQRKKEETYRRRKRKNIDIINDNDDVIAELIQNMKQAAEDDFELNKNRQAATRKLKLLPVVETQLRKIDLREAFLDAGVLGVITDWLTPLPDRSLPHLQIREKLLKLLSEFNIMDVDRLKASGTGKAVMYLYKHPKETRDNKKLANMLIAHWSRPIFNLDTDFHSMTKEEREQRDFDHMTKTKKVKVDSPGDGRQKPSEEKQIKPGAKGWVPRARVPMPSTKDYVVRPKTSMDLEGGRSSKKLGTRLDKHLKNFREKKKQMKTQRAVAISIEGRKMSL